MPLGHLITKIKRFQELEIVNRKCLELILFDLLSGFQCLDLKGISVTRVLHRKVNRFE